MPLHYLKASYAPDCMLGFYQLGHFIVMQYPYVQTYIINATAKLLTSIYSRDPQ